MGGYDGFGSCPAKEDTTLDTFRDILEDLGGGLGVTDPVSGPVVLELK